MVTGTTRWYNESMTNRTGEAEGLARECRERYEEIVWRVEQAERGLGDYDPSHPPPEVKVFLDEARIIVGQAGGLWLQAQEEVERLREEMTDAR